MIVLVCTKTCVQLYAIILMFVVPTMCIHAFKTVNLFKTSIKSGVRIKKIVFFFQFVTFSLSVSVNRSINILHTKNTQSNKLTMC